MARRGWVSAEVEPGTWRRVAVFDDGWVELPGFARALSDTRRDLRQALLTLAVFVGALLLGTGADAVGAPGGVAVVCATVAFGALVWGGFLAMRAKLRGLTQSSADADQARRERDQGARVQLAPGASRWRRTSSARELSGSLVGVRAVDADDIVSVEASRDGDDHVVSVRLVDGTVRTLRSTDRRLVPLVSGLSARP